jgi:hypothetical protein
VADACGAPAFVEAPRITCSGEAGMTRRMTTARARATCPARRWPQVILAVHCSAKLRRETSRGSLIVPPHVETALGSIPIGVS